MEIRQLRYFIAAAEAGSVSRAAERCQVAQPSLSQQLRRLEAALGVSLFDRLGRGIALTDAGRAMLPRARRIIGEVDDAQSNLVRDTETTGRLVVGAIPTIAPYVLPPALRQMRIDLPEVEMTIHEATTEDLIDAVVDMRVDCAVMSTPLDHELLEVKVTGQDELLLVVPRGHELAERKEVAWSVVHGKPAVTLREMHCLGKQIEAFCTARGTAPRTVCRSTQLATVFELVEMGLGISIVPEMAAVRHGDDRCRYIRFAQHKPVRQIAIAWRRDRSRPRIGEQLAAIISKQCADGEHQFAPTGE